ncbi:hypothetical protein SteCoe_5403 [Stentor coeruleus]|uniref:EF-hand domain-containing protein n=1 Tax=Stentor coeruleus TaxID=5963 RepID=A0A1R2CSI1_9CILI|nr:hypothetical protein SteCoe_5403 [Stentor coeruleus]
MSFLVQTNDEFIKFQLRSLLIDPSKKKEVKKKLRKLGLYSMKKGFCTYRDFFVTELGNHTKTPKSFRQSSIVHIKKPDHKKNNKSELPSLSHMKVSKSKGIVNTEFFRRGQTAVGTSVLYMLVNKINVLSTPEKLNVRLFSRYENDLDLRFVPVYISSFLSVAENLSKILIGQSMPYSQDIKKIISNVYNVVSTISGNTRKVFVRNKDFRLMTYISAKPWINIIAEPLNKFFFKKYSLLNEQTFEDFIGNYIFTHNLINQKRLCYELYDKAGMQYITSKHVFAFFESPIFPFVKSDLFSMINYLSNDRYTEETNKLRRASTRIIHSEIFKTIASEPKKMTYKAFAKLHFEQKFPDMLLAVAYALFEDAGSNFLTKYYTIAKYKVTFNGECINVARPINICKDYLKVVKAYYQIIKPEVKSYKPRSENFTIEMLKGAVVSFMLGCNAEYLCEYRQLGATSTSLKEGSLVILGKSCPVIMERIFSHIVIPHTLKITLWEFLDYIEGYFIEDEKYTRCFDLYDADGDGSVSVMEMIGLMDSGDFALTVSLEEEVAKLADLMENKRFITHYGGGFIDKNTYQNLVAQPAFPSFFKERLIYNYRNMNTLYQKRFEILMAEN